MESKEYFEKVMQDYNQHRNGRSLRKYCSDEGVDYSWVMRYKKSYPVRKPEPAAQPEPDFIELALEEPAQPEPQWSIERLVLSSSSGDLVEIKCSNLFLAAEILHKMCQP